MGSETVTRDELAAQLVAERAGNRVAAKAEIDVRAAEQTERIALRNRIAVLDVKIERLRNELSSTQNALACEQAIARSNCDEALKAGLEQGYARRWAAAWKRAASKFRAWQADTEAALEQERRAVGKLASQAVALGCPPGMSAKCPHGDKMVAYMDGKCARCWAAWARERAREEAAKQNGADNGDS